MVGNTVIKRLYTGTLWAEGPAWNGVGRYLVWSDIPNNVQMRWIEEDGRVTVFRNPSGYSNGNTFDFEGRQLSCEHGGRRVVRYEYERHRHRDRRQVPGQAPEFAQRHRGASRRRHLVHRSDLRHPRKLRRLSRPQPELKEAVYRVDPKTGQMDKMTDELISPTASAFRPITRRSTSPTPARRGDTRVYDLDGKTLRNGKRFVKLEVPGGGAPSAADGIRCDVDGNLWCGARARRADRRARRRRASA